jgi:hypothetical protein
MSPLIHITQENPGADDIAAGAKHFQLERYDDNNIFKVAAQARP